MHQLVQLGEVTVNWGIFSLEINSTKKESIDEAAEFRAFRVMRTVMAVRAKEGNDAVGRFYEAVGRRIWDATESVRDEETIKAALVDAGLDSSLHDLAMADPSTWEAVVSEHHELVAGTRTFGVPSITLDGGSGPCSFGPVISHMPRSDQEARELWQATRTLIRYENFSELKRDRVEPPDLEASQARAREAAAKEAAAKK